MTKRPLKIFIIAGEVSGDVLGGKIMSELNKSGCVEFTGIGGENMRESGLKSIFPISDLAVMGLVEVIAKAKTLTRRINDTVAAIEKFRPDIVLTIDSSSFAKQVIHKVKAESEKRKAEINIKINKLKNNNSIKGNSSFPLSTFRFPLFYHVVAPMVWAWGPWRAKKFAKIFDRLYAFFDFEVPYFTKHGLTTIPVGHPIADGLTPPLRRGRRAAQLVAGDAGAGQKNIALIPGSRMSEVRKLLPVMKSAAEILGDDYKFFIPVVETTREYIERETRDWCVRPTIVPAAKRYELYAKTHTAICASGTATAELAIMHVPAVVVYKMNPITMFFGRFMIHVKWSSLVSILLNRPVYPELIGGDATPENIVAAVRKLDAPAARKKMELDFRAADKLWTRGRKSPAKIIADDILKITK